MKYAVVDMGSNSMRLSVYDAHENGDFDLIFSEKKMAGLANYIEYGALSRKGIEVACEILRGFQWILRHFNISDMHVFATASLRNIKNTDEASEDIYDKTDIKVDVLSGKEEAELGYYGAITKCDENLGAMFDIGGGSTEVTSIKIGKIQHAQSVGIGSLNLFNLFVSKIWPDKSEIKQIRECIDSELESIDFPDEKSECIGGIGGTARAALKISNFYFDRPETNRFIYLDELKEISSILTARRGSARKLILKNCPDRIHTILPGIIIMDELCRRMCSDKIFISKYGVREGYLCRRLMKHLI